MWHADVLIHKCAMNWTQNASLAFLSPFPFLSPSTHTHARARDGTHAHTQIERAEYRQLSNIQLQIKTPLLLLHLHLHHLLLPSSSPPRPRIAWSLSVARPDRSIANASDNRDVYSTHRGFFGGLGGKSPGSPLSVKQQIGEIAAYSLCETSLYPPGFEFTPRLHQTL